AGGVGIADLADDVGPVHLLLVEGQREELVHLGAEAVGLGRGLHEAAQGLRVGPHRVEFLGQHGLAGQQQLDLAGVALGVGGIEGRGLGAAVVAGAVVPGAVVAGGVVALAARAVAVLAGLVA